jgi:hypothetical protein
MRLALALLLLSATPALAQFDTVDQTKTYVSNPDACAGAAEGDFEAIGDAMVLRFPDGIEAYEFHCDFFEVKSVGEHSMLLVEAICEVPGARNPDLLSISPYSEGEIEVVSLYDSSMIESSEDNPNPGTTIYHACD